MQTITTPVTGPGESAPFRELTTAETDHVSGGIVPAVVLAAIIVTAVLQECSGGDDSDGGEQNED